MQLYSLFTLLAAAARCSGLEWSPVVEARATASSASLPTVTARNNGSDRFYIRGVDYQPGGSSAAQDPLADSTTCKRDIKVFQELGLNAIRVYTVDNSVNHDECMGALADAGIYLAVDLNTPLYSLNRDEPSISYNPTYLQSVFATVDAFAGYSNTLLFFSGNEVLNISTSTTAAAPYVKAVTRDVKQYIAERGYRNIPVGYSAADVPTNQYAMAQYMDCGDAPSRSDFYSINNYEWCDPSSFDQSGWDILVDQYKNYSLPLFLSEYGCVTNTRTFQETAGLYQTDMTTVFSGGFIYEYSQEVSGFGLVTISGNTATPVGQQVADLTKQLADTPNPSGSGDLTTSGQVQSCPGQSNDWDTSPFTGTALPAIPAGAVKYLKNGAGKGPGLSGSGSQEAPGGSSGTASANAGAATTTYGSGSTPTSSKGAANALRPGAGVVDFQACRTAMGLCLIAASMVFGATLVVLM